MKACTLKMQPADLSLRATILLLVVQFAFLAPIPTLGRTLAQNDFDDVEELEAGSVSESSEESLTQEPLFNEEGESEEGSDTEEETVEAPEEEEDAAEVGSEGDEEEAENEEEVATEETPAEEPGQDKPGLVERRNYVDISEEKSGDRSVFGALFSLGVHNYIPYNYQSALLPESYFEDIFEGQPAYMAEIEIGVKMNAGPMPFGLGAFGGMSSTSISDELEDFTLDIKKYGGTVRMLLDNITPEPWVVPHVSLSAWQMAITERLGSETDDYTTGIGMTYGLGLMINMNWLDESTLRSSRHEVGLENTFLDLYAIKYENTQSDEEGEPLTEADWNYGLSLVWEF